MFLSKIKVREEDCELASKIANVPQAEVDNLLRELQTSPENYFKALPEDKDSKRRWKNLKAKEYTIKGGSHYGNETRKKIIDYLLKYKKGKTMIEISASLKIGQHCCYYHLGQMRWSAFLGYSNVVSKGYVVDCNWNEHKRKNVWTAVSIKHKKNMNDDI